MKVCPVQRFGLKAVTEHFLDTGEILGKGTDELEGFHWLDGRHYGPGEKPRITKEFMAPLGIVLEPGRLDPPAFDPCLETAEVVA
jgi:epoxyqueuosine reductase